MGRRSINTTKSGKYMNPTDQARKEARKKELKKNKRQRQAVRAAVLKMKDPQQIIEELDKIDEMEFNVLQPSPLNEKVLKEKRKKLRETFDRVLKMYDKDEPEKWLELKRQEMEYEKRRAHLISYYESVKHAQSVQVDDIPLPTLPTQHIPENFMYGNMSANIPLPVGPAAPIKPILKKDTAYKERHTGGPAPGVPPGPPPDLEELLREAEEELEPTLPVKKKSLRFSDIPEDDGPPGETELQLQIFEPQDRAMEVEEADSMQGADATAPKPTSLQQRMLALSGQNIDDFMKEMEEVHRKRERDRAADLNARLSALDKRRVDNDSDSDDDGPVVKVMKQQYDMTGLQPPGTEPRPPPPPRPPPLMPPVMRPPPLRMPLPPGVPGIRPIPGPPPGRPSLPPGPPPGLPPRMMRPPGPPPGAPPRMLRPAGPPPPPKAMPVSVLSAAPQLIQKKEGAQSATISAKPQIRNLSADVTRFVPSALRVKRESKKPAPTAPKPLDLAQQPTKDDAYMQFMKEMQGLL